MEQEVYVLGMAKSCLQLKAAGTSRNLELDVLRMIYCLTHLKNEGRSAKGYILIFNDRIKNTIENVWLNKYHFYDRQTLEVLTFSDLPDETIEKIRIEKAANSSFTNSIADYSKETTELFLKTKIEKDFSEQGFVFREKSNNSFPSGINWDFYQVAEKKSCP